MPLFFRRELWHRITDERLSRGCALPSKRVRALRLVRDQYLEIIFAGTELAQEYCRRYLKTNTETDAA